MSNLITPNEVYILTRSRKKYLSVVIIDSLEITEEKHNKLDELYNNSDLFFVFKEDKLEKRIDYRKFSYLYRALGFVLVRNNEVEFPVEVLFKSLLYFREVFSSFIYYGITKLSKLSFETSKFFSAAEKVLVNQVNAEIFNITRYSADKLALFYTLEEPNTETGVDKIKTSSLAFFDFIGKSLCPIVKFWKGKNCKWNSIDDPLWNAYSTHYSVSDILFIPASIMNSYLDFWMTDETNVVRSFKDEGDNFEVFASLADYLKIQYVNEDILKLKI